MGGCSSSGGGVADCGWVGGGGGGSGGEEEVAEEVAEEVPQNPQILLRILIGGST